ncbi:MAG: DUF4921 family protein [Acidobacteria bacterium]|nr:DUF4921 family protein [Acidobacteriota bacterium]
MPSPSNPKPKPAAGAEWRTDLRGEPVLLSPGRAARPYDFRSEAAERRNRCPFCPGREGETPPEVAAERPAGVPADAPGWSWRVVPNRFPAFPREPAEPGGAFGVHEVLIETPDHDRGLGELSEPELISALGAWRRRLQAAAADPRLRYASLFKNHGPEAGASLEHSHSQLMAIPFVPARVRAELAAFGSGEAGARLDADAAHPALRVTGNGGAVAFAPAASRFPDEVWIAPAAPEACFEETADVEAPAAVLRAVLGAMNALHGRPSYHLLLATAPFRAEGRERWRWRIEVFPRLTKIGGFEWAGGLFVNQTDPVDTARRYRAAL